MKTPRPREKSVEATSPITDPIFLRPSKLNCGTDAPKISKDKSVS
jgi:hypothetical protein